jgi:molybdopterin converting factor small subunit
MAVVRLRSPLRDLAGGQAETSVEGATVGAALRSLERLHPPITGWILDEHGRIREHVNVFHGGERASETTPVEPGDVLHVLSAISGGDR